MRMKSLVVFRARFTSVEEQEMDPNLMLVLESIWEPSTMTKE